MTQSLNILLGLSLMVGALSGCRSRKPASGIEIGNDSIQLKDGLVSATQTLLPQEAGQVRQAVGWEYLGDQRWDHAGHFVGGYATIWRSQSGSGLLDKSGRVVVEPIWDEIGHGMLYQEPGPFFEGLCMVKREGKWGFVDKDGMVAIEPEWAHVSVFEDGISIVNVGGRDAPIEKVEKGYWDPGGKWGSIDKTGKVVVNAEWDDIGPLAGEGFYVVTREGRYGIVKRDGTVVVQPDWEDFKWAGTGLYAVARDGKWGVIKSDGTVVVKMYWDRIESFSDGLAPVRLNGKWGAINENGVIVIDPVFGALHQFYSGQASMSRGAGSQWLWGLVDRTGKVLVEPEWETLGGIGKNRYAVRRNGKHGVVDSSGKIVVEVKWDGVMKFSESHYFVARDDKWGLVKMDGEVAVDPKWELRYGDGKIVEGLCVVRQNGKSGFIDGMGRVVIEPKWDAAASFCEGVARVRQGEGWGLIDRNGKVVLQPQYEILGDMSEGLVWVEGDTESGYVDDRGVFVIRGPNWKYCSQVRDGIALVQERDHGWNYRFIRIVYESAN